MSEPAPEPPYKSHLSTTQIELLEHWHEQAYSSLRDRQPGVVDYLGRQLDVPAHVFAPTPVSDLLGNAVLREVRPTDRVLDMGTGSGVNAILAASIARDVVGVDVNPLAVKAATKNAEDNGVASVTRFVESDVFDSVEGSFDLIVFDPPFRWLRPRDMLERSISDEGYTALTRFMREASQYLSEAGRILLFFGTSGDIAYLHDLMAKHQFNSEVVASRDLLKEGVTVVYSTFRLTLVHKASADA